VIVFHSTQSKLTFFPLCLGSNIIDGGVKETIRRRWITSTTEDEIGPYDSEGKRLKFEAPRSKTIAENFQHFVEIHKPFVDKFYVPKGHEMLFMTHGQTHGGYPGWGLALATFTGQCSADQIGWWLPLLYTFQITCSYSQTELGTGSNVRGLATTAHFDKETQEFVLNTPTLRSMKWWPSSLTSSTHTIVYAQLILDGKEYGTHPFLVQVRDENLHQLPGVEVLDVGLKAGENEVDIGALRLKDVRIPRRHLFEKRQHISPDGKYVKHDLSDGGGSNNEKGSYLTMMTARVMMVAGASIFLSKAATIAVRYSAVRRQGFKESEKGQSYKSEQNKIIDYKMNQFLLMKNLALAFAIRFTSKMLSDRMNDIATDNTDAATDLSEMHATSAGLKGYCCYASTLGIEEMRKACGGAGYLMASGIAKLEADYKWRATAEGDTFVMLLETAKYLMKACKDAQEGRELSGLAQCLAVLRDSTFAVNDIRPKEPRTADDLMSIDYLLEWFKFRTIAQVKMTRDSLDARMKAGESFNEAWKALTLRAIYTGQSHVLYFMLTKFAERVKQCEDAACQAVLQRLCVLFALADMMDGKQWQGLYDISTFTLIEEATSSVCNALRPDSVALVDSWDYTDAALNSTIGAKDGNIYERQYTAALRSETNKSKKPEFLEAIKPYLDLEFLALRNKSSPMCDPDDTTSYPPALQSNL